ncbi:TauD/TfdA dioxygenase family protein [Candidimonas nitroreducens]|uniref:Taurine dioxygenase n=1 Tax=Candidimonas nitroreducens TaxID=683354 RepID=A0A225M7P4_9BURK|nr:TauD/TfdA family dioxygenase [Candidimonas nitroreducens]OWT56742.1 taurine dioxygenase [Candidimonas nitroreducens]
MKKLEIRRLAGAMGAEILNVDLANVDEETWEAIHDAYLQHIAIFFPNQQLDVGQFRAWGMRFGSLDTHPYLKPIEGFAPVHELYKGPADKVVFGGEWHADFTFLPVYPQAISLYAQITPAYGGDTLYANRYLAYETLPQRYKDLLESMEAVFSITDFYEGNVQLMRNKIGKQVSGGAVHKVVQVHPETGRKNLLACPAFIKHFVGMTVPESKPLIEFLVRHSTRPELTARYSWKKNTVGIWDNRAALHYAINDYAGMERHMYRLVVSGQEAN